MDMEEEKTADDANLRSKDGRLESARCVVQRHRDTSRTGRRGQRGTDEPEGEA